MVIRYSIDHYKKKGRKKRHFWKKTYHFMSFSPHQDVYMIDNDWIPVNHITISWQKMT